MPVLPDIDGRCASIRLEATEPATSKNQWRGFVPSEIEYLAHDDHMISSQVPSVNPTVETAQRLTQARWMRIRAPMRIDVKLLARPLRKMQGEIHLLM